MIEYLTLLDDVLTNGKAKTDPQGVGNYSVFGRQVRFDLKDGFPLITCRDMKGPWKALRAELLWILSGSTNAYDLHQYGVKLWDQWATPETSGKLGYSNGELGPVYGHQLRKWDGDTDQLTQVMNMMKARPNTRRGMISYWNLKDIEIDLHEITFIAPCVAMLHFSHQDGDLNLHLFQRAVDLAGGAPFDIAQYSLLLMMAAHELNMQPGTLVYTLSDAHIYKNQVDQVKELLKRQPYSRPGVNIIYNSQDSFQHQMDDFQLTNYEAHPAMKIPVST